MNALLPALTTVSPLVLASSNNNLNNVSQQYLENLVALAHERPPRPSPVPAFLQARAARQMISGMMLPSGLGQVDLPILPMSSRHWAWTERARSILFL
ncbi:hypothetical protein CC2G_009166 [Coprinopsis cinerea AmutBmut pab1-1]|nr:hypothetical protein CC2G_009166 [Coprinopsis cinerea AmutBmut pab1-1]